MPFQHDFTGTGVFVIMAFRDAAAWKKGHVWLAASSPETSRRAKVS